MDKNNFESCRHTNIEECNVLVIHAAASIEAQMWCYRFATLWGEPRWKRRCASACGAASTAAAAATLAAVIGWSLHGAARCCLRAANNACETLVRSACELIMQSQEQTRTTCTDFQTKCRAHRASRVQLNAATEMCSFLRRLVAQAGRGRQLNCMTQHGWPLVRNPAGGEPLRLLQTPAGTVALAATSLASYAGLEGSAPLCTVCARVGFPNGTLRTLPTHRDTRLQTACIVQ